MNAEDRQRQYKRARLDLAQMTRTLTDAIGQDDETREADAVAAACAAIEYARAQLDRAYGLNRWQEGYVTDRNTLIHNVIADHDAGTVSAETVVRTVRNAYASE